MKNQFFLKLVLLVSIFSINLTFDTPKGPKIISNKLGLPKRQLLEVPTDTLPYSKRALAENSNPLNEKDLCAAVKNFIKKESEISNLIPNKTNMCTNLSKTCCTEKDFKSLEKWWEGTKPITPLNSLNISRKEIRRHKQEDLMLYSTKLIDSFDRMKSYANNMVEPLNKPDDFCINVSNSFKSYLPDTTIFKKEKYFTYAKKCWNFLNSLQTTILCSLCDNEAQEVFH